MGAKGNFVEAVGQLPARNKPGLVQFKEKQANGRNNYCHNIRAFRAGWHMVKPPFEGKEE
jgi:hypothetical protein